MRFTTRRRGLALLAIGVLAATGAFALHGPVADAQRGLVVLGAGKAARPACPASQTGACQAVGRMTGFQITLPGRRGLVRQPFRAPFGGRIVAWSIKLSQPNPTEMNFFNNTFGGQPRAGIAVLRSLRRGKKRRFAWRLMRQSPIENLGGLLGQTTTFTLRRPLGVRRGEVVAITVPTWVPAFSINHGKRVRWRASRGRRCNARNTLIRGTPQRRVGSRRSYRCAYNSARLLYSATLVRAPRRQQRR